MSFFRPTRRLWLTAPFLALRHRTRKYPRRPGKDTHRRIPREASANMTRHKSHSPAQTPSTAAREHARRARRNMLTPPTSSPYFPQRMTPSLTGPGYSQGHAGFQTYYSTVTSSSNLSSPPDAEYCNTSRESSVPESASSDGKDDDVESEASEEMDVDRHDLPIKGNVYWDKKLDCPARPISKPCEETVYPGPMGPRTKCICGELVGGKRVPLRSAKKHHYNGPKFTFDEKLGNSPLHSTNKSPES